MLTAEGVPAPALIKYEVGLRVLAGVAQLARARSGARQSLEGVGWRRIGDTVG